MDNMETNVKTKEFVEKRMKRRENILILVESALMLALATVLSEISIPMPFGGGITFFSQLPVILLSYRRGLKWGLGTGFAMSLLQALLGLNNYAYIAKTFASIAVFFLFDYIIAFSVLGLGGMFRNKIKNQAVSLALGSAVVSFARYICHVISGIAIWYEYATDDFFFVKGLQKILAAIFGNMEFWTGHGDKVLVVLYSVCYNGVYMFFETLATIFGAVMISLVLNIKGGKITPARKSDVRQ